MTEERASAVPDQEALAALQEAIQAHLEAGAPVEAARELEDLNAYDQAEVVSELRGPGVEQLLGALPTETVAEILEHLEVSEAAEISGLIDVDRMANVLDSAPPDVAVDVLRHLDWSVASQVLARMEDRRTVGDLLLYPDEAAGGLMTPEVAGVREDMTVSMAVAMLRRAETPRERMRQLFAIDRSGRLVGSMELSDLVFAPGDKRVRDVMNVDPVSVETGTDKELCAQLMARYDLLELPVVDGSGVLVGAIAVDDLVDVARDEASEDMFRMFGIRDVERAMGPVALSMRSRLPWLVLNLATALLAGFVLNLFDGTIDKATFIAAFIPVVMGQAGIAGTQTVTVIVRSIAVGEVGDRDTMRLLRRELVLAILQGIVISLILGVVAFAWRQDTVLSVIVASAMLANLGVAGLSGVLVPLGLRLARVDPATSSAVFVTTFTDVMGLLIYLGLATIFLTRFEGF